MSDFFDFLLKATIPPCSYRAEVIAVTAPNYEVDKVRATEQAKERGLEIIEFRESEFVRPGRIFFVCPFCDKEV